MTEPKDIDEALLMLQSDPPLLTKNKDGQVGNQKTRYADLVQVNAQVLSRLNALGLVWKCRPDLELPDYRFVLRYELKHIASGTAESGIYPLKGENAMQQGSAITYARRYALLAVTGIAAEDEDDDGDMASGRQTAQRATPRARQQSVARGRDDRPATAQQSAQRQRPPLPGESGLITDPQQRKLHALLRDNAMTDREHTLAWIGELTGRTVQSTKELTVAEAGTVIDALDAMGGEVADA